MTWWYGGSGWAGWLVMGLVMLVFWSAVVVGGIALWRGFARSDRAPRQAGPPSGPSAERLLDERFARGEIDVDEYKRRREVLGSGH